jgi:TPR repeat protein
MKNNDASLMDIAMLHVEKKEYGRAVEYLEKGALSGDAEAIFHLALMYWEGQGVKSDIKKAKELIGSAKLKGHELSDMYWEIICAFDEAGEEMGVENDA